MITEQSVITTNFINFNQTGTCISVGTSKDFRIFNCEPFAKFSFIKEEKKSDNNNTNNVKESIINNAYGIVEMLFSTSLLAIVGLGENPNLSPRKLRIINTKNLTVICDLTFPDTILSVKMNKERLLVLSKEQIYIYDITNMKLLHIIETVPNYNGLMSISYLKDNKNTATYLAYPSPPKVIFSEIKNNVTTNNLIVNEHNRHLNKNDTEDNSNNNTELSSITNTEDNNSDSSIKLNSDINTSNEGVSKIGDIILFNLNTLQPIMVIEAHKGEISALTLNFDGTLLATASEKGTIIRIFCVNTGKKLYQFRRGTYPTKIFSISFSMDNKFISVTCSSKTVHIFKLEKNKIIKNQDMMINSDISSHKSIDSSNTISNNNNTHNNNSSSDDIHLSSDNNSALSISNDINSTDDYEYGGEDNTINEEEIVILERRKEPFVDSSRKTVGRMIRKSSQKFTRQAAERLGNIFPIKVKSLLEPSRHFASLKIPNENNLSFTNKLNLTIIHENDDNNSKRILEKPQTVHPPSIYSSNNNNNNNNNGIQCLTYIGNIEEVKRSKCPELFKEESEDGVSRKASDDIVRILPIKVISSTGYLYNYVMDPDRGGDCILISRYSLLED